MWPVYGVEMSRRVAFWPILGPRHPRLRDFSYSLGRAILRSSSKRRSSQFPCRIMYSRENPMLGLTYPHTLPNPGAALGLAHNSLSAHSGVGYSGSRKREEDHVRSSDRV